MRGAGFLLPGLFGVLLLAGCAGGIHAPPAPADQRPIEQSVVDSWVAALRPPGRVLLNFHWKYRNAREAANASGRGSAHIAPGDSLRFDYRGPLGMGAGAAAVRGDSALWAVPEEDVRKLVPNYPLLWAMLGIARPPRSSDRIEGVETPTLTAWRYVEGGDTVQYVRSRTGKPILMAEVRSGGKRVGTVVTEFDPSGRPIKSQLDVPSGPARLSLTFTRWSNPASFDADLWNAPDH